MTAIFRRELRSYLKGSFGWSLMAAYLLGFGIFLTVFNLVTGEASFSYPVSYIQPVLILLIPLMSVRALAEEREKGTEEMLFALPLSTTGIVLGKYFAVLTLFAIPTAVCAVYPLLLSLMGKLSLGIAYTALLGLLLLGCALIALCFFLSALCKKRLVAALVGIGSLLLIYFFNVFADLLGGVPVLSDLLYGINPFSKANALLYGQMDLTAMGYLLVLTVVLLTFTVLLIKARRGFGKLRRGIGYVLGACALSLAVVLQPLLGLIPYTASHLDVTGERIFAISNGTREWLGTVEEDVTLYFLSDGGASHASQDLYRYLLDYAQSSPRVTVKVVNTRVDTEFMKKHAGASEMSNYSIIVESGRRYKMIDLYDLYYYYNSYMGLTMSAYEYMAYLSAAQSGNTQSEYYTYGMYLLQYGAYTQSYFDGNSILTNAIRFVTLEEIPTVYVLTGNGASIPDTAFCNEMDLHGYGLRPLASLGSMPEGCDVLMMYMPTKDLTAAEESSLRTYLNGGGKLYLTTSYTHTDLPHLAAVLAEFGLSASTDMNVVCEGDDEYYVSEGSGGGYPYYVWSHVASHEATGSDFSGELILRFAHSLTLTETPGVTQTKWLYTTDKGYLMMPNEDGSDSEISAPGEQIMGVIAQKGEGTVVWISSPDAVTGFGNIQSSGGNFSLARSCFGYLSGYTGKAVELEPAEISTYRLDLSGGGDTLLAIAAILVLPGACLATGLTVHYVRKKRT